MPASGAAVTNVSFYEDGILLGTNLHSPYGLTWSSVTNGIYVLMATATDTNGAIGVSPNVTVVVAPPNQPPSVYAGPDQVTNMPAAELSGLVSDDGLPSNLFVCLYGRKISVPIGGTVKFGDSNQPATTATFNTNGVYRLQLSGTDRQQTNTSTVQITVLVTNLPPNVNAGTGQTVFFTKPSKLQLGQLVDATVITYTGASIS